MTLPRKSTQGSIKPLNKIASIDIGSNTLRLLIAEKKGEGFRPLFRDREMVRLGRNFYPNRLLSAPAMEDAVKTLKRFKDRAEQEEVTRLLAVGTGILREADNLQLFLEKVKEETDISIRIISGGEEARIMAKGVLSLRPPSTGKTIIVDIGGGSTEFVFVKHGQMDHSFSLPLGVVGLTEKFLQTDPPLPSESDSLKAYCRNILRKNSAKNDNVKLLIGTAGTVTTLAAMTKNLMDYNPEQINGTVLTFDNLLELSEKILMMPFKNRAKLTGLEAARADIINAGILLVLEIMDHYSQKEMLVSDAGLLEGLILNKGPRFKV